MEQADTSGPSAPAGLGRRARSLILVGGAAVGLTLAGLGFAAAQTTTSSPPSSTTTTTAAPAPPEHKGGHPGRLGFGSGFGALHGEFTTRAPGGGFQTLATQVGDVTSVSASSIEVKSEDGFTRTYTVDDNTVVTAGDNGVADVKTGDTARIVALVNGGKANAVAVLDATRVRQSTERWRPAPRAPSGTEEKPAPGGKPTAFNA